MKLLFQSATLIMICSALLYAAVAQENVTVDDSSCTICPEGEVMNNADTVLRINTAGFTEANQTCQDIEDLAISGSYSFRQCSLLNASSVALTCGCGEPGETKVLDIDSGGTTKVLGISVFLASALVAVTTMLLNGP